MSKIAMISVAHIHSKSFCEKLVEISGEGGPYVIWDEMAERGQRYAEKYHSRYEPDLQKVLDDPAIEGFVICAENTRHLPLLERVLALGKPTMCEKPLTTTVADARRVAELVREHGTPLTNGYFQPFNAQNRGVKQLLTAQKLGKVTHATFRNAHHAAYGRWFDSPELSWFTDPQLAGGGALLDMGTHAVHLLCHLFGEVDRVWAMHNNYSGNYEQVDDYGMIVMQFANGVLGRVEAGWVFTGGHNGLEIIGSDQSIWQAEQMQFGARGQTPQPVPPADDRPDRIDRLIAVIQQQVAQQELAEDLTHALRAVAIMEAAYQSHESGTWVEVPRIG